MIKKISIIGAGSWGTAIAKTVSEKGFDTVIWAFENEVAKEINKKNRNPVYLKETLLPKTLHATNDLKEALDGSELVLSVVPSHALRQIWQQTDGYLPKNTIVVSCTKGIEATSLKLMSEVLCECLPGHPSSNFSVMSGPSFAAEVALKLPTSVVIAGKDSYVCKTVQETLRTDCFLTFTSDDVIGVEVGGAVKNVIAIAAGISDGLKLGHNSRAAIITRGVYEMIKIGNALGANPLTFAGLSGIGDLVLTCTADLSRNHTVGKLMGEGHSFDNVTVKMKMVAEGISTSKAVYNLAKKHSLNVPICNSMYRILFEGLKPKDAVNELCSLPLKEELGSILKSPHPPSD